MDIAMTALSAQIAPRRGRSIASPLARRIAREAGLDLASIRGSGPLGRVVEKDVRRILRGPAAPPSPQRVVSGIRSLFAADSFEEIPIDGMRGAIAERTSEAKRGIPHFYLSIDCDVTAFLELRGRLNEATNGAARRISISTMIVRAWALALQRVPAANSVWAGDRILRLKNCDIGVGVAVDGGIITPVLRRVEERSLGEIAAEMQLLVGQARARRLAAGDHAAATAISNLGMYGVREFQAIIDPPGSTMLAIGACRPCNVVRNRQSVVADMMTVTLSCDHRVMDGALGAELLSSFRQLVENPFAIVV